MFMSKKVLPYHRLLSTTIFLLSWSWIGLCTPSETKSSNQLLLAKTDSTLPNTQKKQNQGFNKEFFNKLAEDEDADIRQEVVQAAGETGDPEAISLLEKMITDKNNGVKKTVINSLIHINKQAMQFLTQLAIQKEEEKRKKENKGYFRRYGYKNSNNIYNQIIQNAQNKAKAEKKAISLAKQTKKKIIQLLNKMAKDKNVDVRDKVVQAAGETGDPEAISLLKKMASDESSYVKRSIINSLMQINKKAMQFLARLAHQKEQENRNKKNKKYRSHSQRSNYESNNNIYNQIIALTKYNKAKAEKKAISLAEQTKKRVIQLLNKMAKDKNADVRDKVAQAAGETNNPEAINLLEKMASDKSGYVKQSIVESLAHINRKAMQFLAHLAHQKEQENRNKKNKKYPFSYSRKFGRNINSNIYNQMIIMTKHNKAKVEKEAISLAEQTKKKVIQLLNKMAKDKNANVRDKVAQIAGETNNPKAISLLEKMASDESEYVKISVISSLLHINRKAMQFLAHLAHQKKQEKRKKENKKYFRRSGYKSSNNVYNQTIIMAKHNKAKVEKKAISLAEQTKKKMIQLLNKMAKDKNVDVRDKVAQAAGETNNPQAISLLEKMATKDEDKNVRKTAIRSIGTIRNYLK